MTEPENEEINNGQEQNGFDGSYRFNADELRENMYSDARFSPADENTVPPRYYTPPEHQEKTPREPRKQTGQGKRLVTACLCLCCIFIGGVVGAGLMAMNLSKRIDALEARNETVLDFQMPETTAIIGDKLSKSEPIDDSGRLLASAIYDKACAQVVGINSNITYTNLFGYQSSSPVSGTGFILSEDGYILTNYHVIEYAVKGGYDVNVMTHDGESFVASVVGYEEYNDVAVLKIDKTGLSNIIIGDSDGIMVGDEVYAVGNPLGELDFSMTTGHVSALDRLITNEENVSINMFQMDAAVNEGNSGGPVYDTKGRVIGIVTAKYSKEGVEGLGFALPINDVVKIAADLISKGYVTGKAYMGVTTDQRYNSMYSQYYNLPLGAYVSSVEGGSCAQTAGIQKGDIITQIGDIPITSYTEIGSALYRFSAGEETVVKVYRTSVGDYVDLDIVFDEARS